MHIEINVKLKLEYSKNKKGCFICKKSPHKSGYALVRIFNKQHAAHRIVWESINGYIPDGMVICHKCDIRNCINPDHLFLGTQKENVLDAINKGRWSKRHGNLNPMSKLTEKNVMNIRKEKDLSLSELSKKYNVSVSTIYRVVKRTGWSHL